MKPESANWVEQAVLVVTDDLQILALAQAVLAAKGKRALVASDLPSAVRLLKWKSRPRSFGGHPGRYARLQETARLVSPPGSQATDPCRAAADSEHPAGRAGFWSRLGKRPRELP